jgi:lactose/L-arabinose transport system substrate-binding protein
LISGGYCPSQPGHHGGSLILPLTDAFYKEKTMNHVILKFTLALALLTTLWAQAQTPADELTPNPDLHASLEIWAWEGAAGALQAVDEEFNEYYPNIELNYVLRPTGDTYQQIQLGAVAGGGLPDVSNIEDSHLRQFVELGILYDLTDRVASYVPLMNEFKWLQSEMDGRYYAMPNDSGPVALFYRRDVFEQAGVNPEDIQTWEDYYEAAQVIMEETGTPMWQQATAQNNARLFEILMWQRGLGYIDPEDGSVILDRDERILEILEFMGRFWQEGMYIDAEEWTDAWYRNFNDPNVATHPGAVWMGTFFKDWMAPDAFGQWGVIRLPAWEEGGSQASNDGGSSLVIFEQSNQKEAAWAYVEFHLGRTASQLDMFIASDIFPSLETVYDDPYFDEPDPYYGGQVVRRIFTDVVQEIPEAGVYNVNYQEMNSLMSEQIQRFAVGQISAQEALAAAAREIRSRTGRP